MKGFGAGLALGLGLITLMSILLFQPSVQLYQETQLNLLRVLMAAYTPLLTPLSSIAGAEAVGGEQGYGVLPIIIWLVSAFSVGFLLGDIGKSAKTMFASASIIILTWIAAAFLAAPSWMDTDLWLRSLDAMASDLLINRPMDLLSTLIIPPTAAALAATLSQVRIRRGEAGEQEDYLSYPEY